MLVQPLHHLWKIGETLFIDLEIVIAQTARSPRTIDTDDRGQGRAELSRCLTAPSGTQFDIHFRVIDALTREPVLASGCYLFTVSL